MTKCLLLAYALCRAAASLHAAPTRTVTVPWTAPAPTASWKGCVAGMPACYYYVYRSASLTSGSVDCPVAGGPSYALLNGAAPAPASPYVDTRAPKASVCYYARTVQGGRTSAPSNARLYKWR